MTQKTLTAQEQVAAAPAAAVNRKELRSTTPINPARVDDYKRPGRVRFYFESKDQALDIIDIITDNSWFVPHPGFDKITPTEHKDNNNQLVGYALSFEPIDYDFINDVISQTNQQIGKVKYIDQLTFPSLDYQKYIQEKTSNKPTGIRKS